jgi:hypothetical protein
MAASDYHICIHIRAFKTGTLPRSYALAGQNRKTPSHSLSNLQLLSGSGIFVLNLPYMISGTWIEHGWLSSLWEFSSYAKLRYHTSDICWQPKKQRENGSFIMEFFLTLTKNLSILRALNHCRVYLQVLLVSDIATADGHQLLPEVKLGYVPNQKSSL